MDDDRFTLYEPFLFRGGKLIERKGLSLEDSGKYIRWVAETLVDSSNKKRRIPYHLLYDLIPVLMEAADKAILAGELSHHVENGGEEAKRAFEKAKDDAFNTLLSGFGFKPQKGGEMAGRENKGGRARRPAASFWEVVKYMDAIKHGSGTELSVRKAAASAAEKFNIGESTARRYWRNYENLLNRHEE